MGCKKERPEETFLVYVIFFSVGSQRARAGRDLWFDPVWFRSSDKGGNWGPEKGRNQSRGAHSGGRAALSILETDTALGLVSMKWFNKWGLMAYKIIETTRVAKFSRSCWHRVLLLSCQSGIAGNCHQWLWLLAARRQVVCKSKPGEFWKVSHLLKSMRILRKRRAVIWLLPLFTPEAKP